MNEQYIINAFLPIIIPILVAGIKKVADKYFPMVKIPKLLVPLVATGLGVLGGYVAGLTSAYENNFYISAALGIASVGVRELAVQFARVFQAEVPMIQNKSSSGHSGASSSSSSQ